MTSSGYDTQGSQRKLIPVRFFEASLNERSLYREALSRTAANGHGKFLLLPAFRRDLLDWWDISNWIGCS